MENNLLSIILLALVDSLNPSTIITVLVLMPIVKKRWYSLIFIFGTFLIYLIVGLAIFLGLDVYLKAVIDVVTSNFAYQISIIEVLAGIGLIIYGLIEFYKLFKSLKNKQPVAKDFMGNMIKVITPFTLTLLAITSTLSDLPTAIPYIGFIGIVSTKEIELLSAIVLFVLYCFIYIAPMLILYFIYNTVSSDKFNKITDYVKLQINRIGMYLLPVIILVLGVLLLLDGLSRL